MFGKLKSKTGASPARPPKQGMIQRLLGSPSCLVPAAPATPPAESPLPPATSPLTPPLVPPSLLPVSDKASPKRVLEEEGKEEGTPKRGKREIPAARSPPQRKSNSPQRQLRPHLRAAQSQSPISDITPPGISAVMKQVRRDKIKKKRVWDSYFNCNSSRQPCPGCGQTLNTTDYNFEIQQMIPRGFGADDVGEEWNMFPLCSNVPEDTEGDEGRWGCSELLEREQCIAVEDMEGEGTPDEDDEAEAFSPNALDWLVATYPNRVHEILIRIQRAHGESFCMPAGESLCLRFARDVYQHGKRQTHDAFSADRDGEWARKGLGFRCDILDLAECFRENTDTEVLRRVELKDLLTPKKHNRKDARTPLSMRRADSVGTPDGHRGSTVSDPKNLTVSFEETANSCRTKDMSLTRDPASTTTNENTLHTQNSPTWTPEAPEFY